MKIFINFFFICFTILFFHFFCFRAIAYTVDMLVGIVNGKIILASELKNTVEKCKKDLVDRADCNFDFFSNQTKSMLILSLIEEKLFEKEIMYFGITVSDEEVAVLLNKIKNISNDSELKLNVFNSMTANIKKQIFKRKLFDHCIYSKVVVTEEEINKYYYNNLKFSSEIVKYDLCMIRSKFVGSSINCKDYGSNFSKMINFAKFLEKTSRVHSLNEISSICKNLNKELNILFLGLFALDELSDIFKIEVSSLLKGRCSAIIRNDMDLTFFYVLNTIVSEKNVLNKVKNSIYKKLILYKSQRELIKWLDSIKQISSIELIG